MHANFCFPNKYTLIFSEYFMSEFMCTLNIILSDFWTENALVGLKSTQFLLVFKTSSRITNEFNRS